jgi:hypothetical protein
MLMGAGGEVLSVRGLLGWLVAVELLLSLQAHAEDDPESRRGCG